MIAAQYQVGDPLFGLGAQVCEARERQRLRSIIPDSVPGSRYRCTPRTWVSQSKRVIVHTGRRSCTRALGGNGARCCRSASALQPQHTRDVRGAGIAWRVCSMERSAPSLLEMTQVLYRSIAHIPCTNAAGPASTTSCLIAFPLEPYHSRTLPSRVPVTYLSPSGRHRLEATKVATAMVWSWSCDLSASVASCSASTTSASRATMGLPSAMT
eukprot:1446755-Rhodomonas_salina.1